MADLMPGEALEVFLPQPCAISHLDPIRPTLRQRTEELVQVSNKVPAMFVIGRPEPGKLKHQQAHVWANRFAGVQERFGKEFRIEKILVGFPGQIAESIQLRESFDG